MDDLSFQLVNTAVGNPVGAPGLECTLQGPRLVFSDATVICVGGADTPVTLDGEPVALWEPVEAPAGSVLDVGTPADTGLRTYVAFRGGHRRAAVPRQRVHVHARRVRRHHRQGRHHR
jgi:urea carboxylase